jgi:ubiquinone/menaquinone biosynthesis C-methylase UbiE
MTTAHLDAQAATPFWQAANKAILGALALPHGSAALDLGCGTGEQTRHMAAAAGAATGVDTSAALVEEARRRTGPEYDARFEVGALEELPYPDATFSGVRADRALQHADDLGAATRELWRVAAPGARIVALEPDWDTLVFDAGPLSATRAVCRQWADGVANPAAGRQIARRLRTLGATDVSVEPRTAALTDLQAAEEQYGLAALVSTALSPAAGRAWLQSLRERDGAGAFLAAVTYFLVSAGKPA